MRFSSDLLDRLIKVTGKGTGREAVKAQDLDLPPVILPVAFAQAPLSRLAGMVAATATRDSFGINFQNNALNTNPTSTIATFTAGPWDLFVTYNTVFDFTNIAFTDAFNLFLQDPAVSTLPLLSLTAVNAVPVTGSLRLQVTFPEDSWALRLTQHSGAAQNAWANVGVIAHRLM